jgi:hypothetical protein
MSKAEVTARFIESADCLGEILNSLPPQDLDCAERDGEWTIRQIVHHLADDCDVWSMCIKRAFATPGVTVRFEGFPGNEAWANGLDFHLRPIEPSLALIRAHRRYLADLFDYFSEDWERCIDIAGEDGKVAATLSAGQMIEMLTGHMLEHIDTIRRISRLTAG